MRRQELFFANESFDGMWQVSGQERCDWFQAALCNSKAKQALLFGCPLHGEEVLIPSEIFIRRSSKQEEDQHKQQYRMHRNFNH